MTQRTVWECDGCGATERGLPIPSSWWVIGKMTDNNLYSSTVIQEVRHINHAPDQQDAGDFLAPSVLKRAHSLLGFKSHHVYQRAHGFVDNVFIGRFHPEDNVDIAMAGTVICSGPPSATS